MSANLTSMTATDLVFVELNAAARHGGFNSPHEGKAVIEEELDELWEHVRANTGRSTAALHEAIQIAAMGVKYAMSLCTEEQGLGLLSEMIEKRRKK